MNRTALSAPPEFETSGRDRPEPGQIWKARCFIQEHLAEHLSLTAVAHRAGISPNYLSEKFKEITGENFVDYIARRRFLRACQLLREPQRKVSEIAFEVGFQSLSQFNRVFKKLSRQSPSQYRTANGYGSNGANQIRH